MPHLCKVLFLIAASLTVVIAATVGVLNMTSSSDGLDFLAFDPPARPTSEPERFTVTSREMAPRDGPLATSPRPEWKRGGPPSRSRPGQVLSPFHQETLRLTDEQKQQIAALQDEVNARMEHILTAEQQNQLQRWREGFGRPAPAVHE